MTSDRDAVTPAKPMTDEAIVKLRKLYARATPLESMPGPFDEDRRYSDREIASLVADKELRRALPALLDAAEENARLSAQVQRMSDRIQEQGKHQDFSDRHHNGVVAELNALRTQLANMEANTVEALALVEANETIAALRKRVEVLELALLRQLDEHDSGHSPCSCQELRAALAAAEREET